MDWKKYLPAVLIGIVVLYLVKKLSSSGGDSSGFYNALVPQSSKSPTNRDSARVAGYNTLASVGLGQLKLAEQGTELTQQVALARDRFAAQLQALDITQQGAFQRLQAELTDRQYDRALQQSAISQTAALAQSGQIGAQAGQALQALLNAITKGRQQSSGGGSGGSGAGTQSQQRRTVPQMTQAAYNRLRQSSFLQTIFGSGDPTADYVTPPFNPGYYGFTDFTYDPPVAQDQSYPGYVGAGSSNYSQSYFDPNFYGYSSVGDLLNDYGYDSLQGFLDDYGY